MKLEIINIDKYMYTLKDEKSNTYNLNIEFFNLKEKPEKGDHLILKDEILKEKNLFNFKIINEESKLKLITKNKGYNIERYYG